MELNWGGVCVNKAIIISNFEKIKGSLSTSSISHLWNMRKSCWWQEHVFHMYKYIHGHRHIYMEMLGNSGNGRCRRRQRRWQRCSCVMLKWDALNILFWINFYTGYSVLCGANAIRSVLSLSSSSFHFAEMFFSVANPKCGKHMVSVAHICVNSYGKFGSREPKNGWVNEQRPNQKKKNDHHECAEITWCVVQKKYRPQNWSWFFGVSCVLFSCSSVWFGYG